MNEEFNDVGILTILHELFKSNMLHTSDKEKLLEKINSDWGKEAANYILQNKKDFPQLDVLRRFSNTFQDL